MSDDLRKRRIFLAAALSKSVAKSLGVSQIEARKLAASEGIKDSAKRK